MSPEDHTRLAKTLFNRTWELIALPNRTVEQDDEMLSTAHASAYHWHAEGTPKNHSISHWQLSRVYALLGRPQSAIHHGQRSLYYATQGNLRPFYHAYAEEALARAHATNNDLEAYQEHHQKAQAHHLEDPEEAAALKKDLETIPNPKSPIRNPQ